MIDGHRMVYLEKGTSAAGRPTVILMHGFAAMKENWAFWLQRLPGHWHILVPDLPGLGESDYHPGARYGYEAQASRLEAWIDTLASDNLHLVGSSMGGAIATVLAHRMTPAPASLTVLNSAGVPEHADVDINAPFESDRDAILIPRDWAGVYHMFNSVGSGRPTAMGVAMTGLLGPDLLQRTRALRHIFDDMLTDALAPARYLGKDTPPLQVQWGDRDVITPTRCVDWFRQVTPGADIRVFPGVGHLPMLENPGRSARALVEFVERHSTRTPAV